MMFARFTDALHRRALAWAEARQGPDPDPVVLMRRRLYILPTRQGLVFGALLFAMLLGSMNYSSNLGFTMTFLLASLGFVAMHHTHRNLDRLELRAGHAVPVFAGDEAGFPVQIRNHAGIARGGIALDDGDQTRDIADIPANATITMMLRVPAPQRGWLRPPRFGIHTTYPFALFRAWAWLRMDLECLVYPAPAEAADTPAPTAIESGSSRTEGVGQEDFTGLRRYRPGDAPRHVAWRASARLDGDLLVKEFRGGGAASRWLDWAETEAAGDVEARVSRLTRWVMDAQAREERYGLRLPGAVIPIDGGEAHYHRCLRELALFESPA